ncbi:LMBR1 domain-containing protein 2 homolog isoform X3 [Arctopsyche grandis]|uniref:LMBR1 domain-containing protein 2 homolog isoform X3 n=1 Tax=Arctopsyche grandis TaxID=121162 RepID=UPI00406D9966
MAATLFITEMISVFLLACCLLWRYGDCYRQHVIVTLAVLTAWYFSFLIIFILPLDISSTVYRNCQQEHNETVHQHIVSNDSTVTTSVPPTPVCLEPWSKMSDDVFPNMWRIVYWTSQCLTWLIMPMMQSYSKAGDFTIKGKLKSALIDNAIYYGSYLFICGVLLIYIALKPGVNLDGMKIKAIASSASNTWGLFLLILLLGYALVEVPRKLWNNSIKGYKLTYCYFKAAKLSSEKCEAEETVDDVLESLQSIHASLASTHPLREPVDRILLRVPTELRGRMERRAAPNAPSPVPSLKALIRLHLKVIKALQMLQRTETQWNILMEKIFHLEDVVTNLRSLDHRFKPTFIKPKNPIVRVIYNPVIEWYWECFFKSYFLKLLAICTAILSISVVWSEVTFFNQSPVLSIFANIVNLAKVKYDYLTIELFSTLMIAYLCFCAYSTVLKIRVFNLYYLAPHHQTNEYSLIFSGMMMCRLTPPMCLNFLSLIQMDSHVISTHVLETQYTQIMGHMDVLSIISDGFNIYFPMLVLLFCIATYFSIGSRLLTMCGFQQFVGDVELTTELVEEGKEIVKREKRKRQRTEESIMRRRDFQGRFGGYNANANDTGNNGAQARGVVVSQDSGYQRADDLFGPNLSLEDEINERFGISTRPNPPKTSSSDFDSARSESANRTILPPKNIFDDV